MKSSWRMRRLSSISFSSPSRPLRLRGRLHVLLQVGDEGTAGVDALQQLADAETDLGGQSSRDDLVDGLRVDGVLRSTRGRGGTR